MRTTKVVAVALAALLLATLGFTAGAPDASATGDGQAALYEVTITNNTTGQYLTPPNWAAHSNDADVFQRGQVASPGVAAVAESGDVALLAGELTSAIDDAGLGVSGVAGPVGDEPGPIGPGESRSFEFISTEARFSVVSMIICTNDGFGGIDSARLPWVDGQVKTYNLRDFDAGAEMNTENRVDVVPAPFCNNPGAEPGGTGGDQPDLDQNNNKIRRHPTLRGTGDQDASFDWARGSVGEVTVTRVELPTTYNVVIDNLTEGQYFTPPNYAAHSGAVEVFGLGELASPGVAAVAELGGVGVLADELFAAVDAAGLGDSGVAGPVGDEPGPIGPGGSRAFDFSSTANRFSLVSMLICTNDGFAGLDSMRLPAKLGESTTYLVRAFDAGVEMNTENRADLVPAPFCDGPGGTADTQDDIAEDGVITRHRTLRGVGDLPDSFDWSGPVLSVTVTNNG